MSLYIGREASKLWKRVCSETATEISLLAENWKYILCGLVFQVGFVKLTVYSSFKLVKWYKFCSLDQMRIPSFINKLCLSVSIYSVTFLHPKNTSYLDRTSMDWLLEGFITYIAQDPHFKMLGSLFYRNLVQTKLTSVRQVLAFLVACQILRIITFYSTQLPGPNYHCREGSKLARLPRPDNIIEVLVINFPRGVLYGCGDLIFSSHMIFSLVFVRTYHKYGTQRFVKHCAWLAVIVQSFLIVASHKHYTVDIVVAWYTVNLVVFFIDKKLAELPDRSGPVALPLTKDNKTKEENHKLLNGNSGDPAEKRPRSQINGKIVENGNITTHAETTMNGV